MSFKGKVVLITGGSSGIGAATAELFAKEGATVVLVGRNEARLQNTVKLCKQYGVTVFPIKADISIDKETDKIVPDVINKFGKLDVLVNAAAILKKSNLLDKDFLDVYDEVTKVDIRSIIRITKFAAPYLIESKGNIVNISSVAASTCKTPGYISYRTAKAALSHFTRCAANELAAYGVRVNEVSPGPTNTDLYRDISVTIESLENGTALEKIIHPEEVARMIAFLAKDEAKSVTGANYVIDNGKMLK